MRIGAHQSIQGGLHNALYRAQADLSDAVQIFTKPPQAWKEPVLSDEAIDAFKRAKVETGIDAVVVHDSYLVNPCAAKPEVRQKSVAALKAEAARCEQLEIEYLVFHPGSPGELGQEEGFDLVARCLKEVLAATNRVQLLVENTAGQGKSIGYRFDHLKSIIERAGGDKRLGVCLDTCHAYAAGYDLKQVENARKIIDELETVVGPDRFRVLHLNDSKKGPESRVDRHALIGEGEIGSDLFAWLVTDPRFADKIAVLETPIAKGETYRGEILKLRSFQAE